MMKRINVFDPSFPELPRAKDTPPPLAAPTYFPYQEKAANWLAAKRNALLSLDMGLGKTAVSILAANKAGCQTALIACPAVAIVHWKRELSRWKANFMSHVISYNSLHYVKRGIYDVLILDESHYLKSINAKRSVQVFGRYGLAKFSKRCWCLSGTPAPNHAAELWIVLFAFGRTKLKYDEFVEKYCKFTRVNRRYYQITGTKKERIEDIRRMLEPIMLRQTASEVGLELPPITYETHVFPLRSDPPGDIWKELYAERDRLKEFLKDSEELSAVANSLPTLRRYSGLQKIKYSCELLEEELDGGVLDSVVVFAHHREVIEAITARLRRFGAVAVYGGVTDRQRQYAIDSFQAGKAKVFVGNIQASGTAITLTRSSNIVFVESDWTPANMAQAVKRCHRIGQTRPLHVRFLSLDDHIDEMITRILERKTKELTQLFRPTGIHGEISSENSLPPENNFEKILD